MNDLKAKILTRVKNDFEEIEAALKGNLNPYLDLVSKVAGHILFSGGKRIRPLLMILSARMCGYGQDHAAAAYSTIFEYLHAATLLHDDLVDGANMRRGRPVANQVWDNPTAVLVGDFLLARALSIAARTRNIDIIDIISGITEYMSQGEIHQLAMIGNTELTEKEYMDVIRSKTAVLFQGTCRVGAILAGVSENRETALAKFGLNLGLAFQMVDDLLDYSQDSQTLGKHVGADLREGKLTLPVIHSLKAADPGDRKKMLGIIQDKRFSVNDFTRLIGYLKKYGGIEYTRSRAVSHIERAKQSLSVFEVSESKEILMDIADYALARKL